MSISKTLRELILEEVENDPGIRGGLLTVKVLSKLDEDLINEDSADSFLILLDQLVSSKDLVKVIYILPSMSHRAKTLYFPKGTQVEI